MALNPPDFNTTASVTGATLISQTDEEIRILMSDVKNYQEALSILVDNYTTEQIESGLNTLTADVQAKIDELLSVNPDGTYYTKTAIDAKIQEAKDESTSSDRLQEDVNYPAYGLTEYIDPEDRFLEADIPNVIVDKVADNVRFSDGLKGRLGDELFIEANKQILSSAVRYSGDNLETGKVYKLKINVNADNPRGVALYNGLTFVDGTTFDYPSLNGTFEYYILGNGNSIINIRYLFNTNTAAEEESGLSMSLKELPQAELPLIPFAPTTSDELLDDSTNGLTCQLTHDEGDIVVTGNELVTNGTFDADSDWTKINNTVISGGNVAMVGDSGNATLYQNSNLIVNREYVLNFEVLSSANAVLVLRNDTTGSTISPIITFGNLPIGNHTYTFTALGNILNFTLGGGALANISLDNISVTLKDNIYQATKDTSLMYDFIVNTTDSVTITQGDIFLRTSSQDDNGHFYERIQAGSTTGVFTDTEGNDLSNLPTIYKDLGTAANMSLENPYFQVIPKVKRQDLILIRRNKSTDVVDYFTRKGTKFFGADYNPNDVMSYYGYSKLSTGLWKDTSYEYAFVSLRDTLNGAGFHPIYNPEGVCNYVDGGVSSNRPWYWDFSGGTDTSYILNSTYPCFIEAGATDGYQAGTIGRPDGKSHDKVYIKGQGGMLPKPIYAIKPPHNYFEKAKQIALTKGDFEEGVEIVYSSLQNASNATETDGDLIILIDDTSHIQVGDNVLLFDGTIYNIGLEVEGILSSTQVNVRNKDLSNNPITRVLNSRVLFQRKQAHNLTWRGSTHTDIIDDPANYPTDWLSWLSSGKSITANALLVGQDGTDLIPDGTSINTIFKKKFLEGYNRVQSSDSGANWNSASYTDLGTDNTLSLGWASGDIALYNYNSLNASMTQVDPIAIEKADNKAYAMNSHSQYKGQGLHFAATGKVATSDSDNSFESRLLENTQTLSTYDYSIRVGIVYTVTTGDKLLVADKSILDGDFYHVYERIGSSFTGAFSTSSTLNSNSNYKKLGIHITTPQHNTLALNNDDSPACKAFFAEGSDDEFLYTCAFTEEMVWDFSADSGADFESQGETYTGWTAGQYYRIVSGRFLGMWRCVNTGGLALTNANFYLNDKEEITWIDGVVHFERWDGNGFGSNGQFDQLTNGNLTDLNGNSVQTKVLSTWTGIAK